MLKRTIRVLGPDGGQLAVYEIEIDPYRHPHELDFASEAMERYRKDSGKSHAELMTLTFLVLPEG